LVFSSADSAVVAVIGGMPAEQAPADEGRERTKDRAMHDEVARFHRIRSANQGAKFSLFFAAAAKKNTIDHAYEERPHETAPLKESLAEAI
jgi:hypothetical protein